MMSIRKNQSWLPSIFNDFFDNDWVMRSAAATSPAINVVEKEKAFEVEVAAPGLTKQDFQLSIDEDVLVIAMEKKEEKQDEHKEGRYIHREFSYASFNQRLALPETINKDQITATVDKGVLRIHLPKLKKTELKKTERVIEIQ